jgi:two-component system, NtrC family, sensor kinase
MKTVKSEVPANRRMGITLRTALLSWLVTIVTLGIFVLVIIPEQKRTFLENLESKAHGVAISLRDVAAGAVVNEDYSSVVEHCVQMLNGDKSIDHLVITRNDGFSLIHDRQKWCSETNSPPAWRPAKREITSGIGVAPVFQRRVFAYSLPFDYSGIQWGWINVGLSLESYDRSVAAVYRRTMVLAALCILFSLLASVVYAKRLVRPILSLRAVVQKVTGGDLAARAAVDSGDELGSLAGSVNSMTEALLRRDQILGSVRFTAQKFLSTSRWPDVIEVVLARIGQAADASRAYVFENQRDPDGRLLTFQRYEWTAQGVSPQIGNPALQGLCFQEAGLHRWAERLQRGEIAAGVVSALGEAERNVLEPQQVQSLILIPIMVEGSWWGILGLDECQREREWTEAERDSLRAAAEMLGAAIARQRTQDALIEAKATLEDRVRERTRELEEQMGAKEKAHRELAEAQQHLMSLSRQAGMAEVATGVLHNVGNVLNSVNVSCNIAVDRLRQSKAANLGKLVGLLEQQNGNLAEFLNRDPKGRQIIPYLSSLAPMLVDQENELLKELHSLRDSVDHIKGIVSMQQNYARIAGVQETLAAAQLVEDALNLNAAALVRHHVEVVRQFDEVPPVCVDKHKVLQILLNLIRNAKLALKEGGREPRIMTVRVLGAQPGKVRLQVCDNGIGIAPENLTRIFSHGFTTRRDGHGFGLHSGALAAKELGGLLTAESSGLGHGATFTLELPLPAAETHKENHERSEPSHSRH